MLESLQARGFQIEFHSHAAAILAADFRETVGELETALQSMSIPIEEIIGSGGGETKGTQRLRRALAELHWAKTTFTIEKTINGVRRESISHEIDHVRRHANGVVALEIEWNNKDPFFDRDLENFKRLHAEGAISVGVIVTRGLSMQDEMVGLIRRFADERQVVSNETLLELGLNPTRRQQSDVERRTRSGLSFAEAWCRNFVQDIVKLARRIDLAIRKVQDPESPLERGLIVHGNRLLVHCVFRRIAETADIANSDDIADDMVSVAAADVFARVKGVIVVEYPDAYLAPLFKNVGKCSNIRQKVEQL